VISEFADTNSGTVTSYTEKLYGPGEFDVLSRYSLAVESKKRDAVAIRLLSGR
jgi:hypothetical protein